MLYTFPDWQWNLSFPLGLLESLKTLFMSNIMDRLNTVIKISIEHSLFSSSLLHLLTYDLIAVLLYPKVIGKATVLGRCWKKHTILYSFSLIFPES